MEKFKEVYLEEIGELLADIEASLLELSGTPDRKELIDSVFRAFHTIKGSGAMFGFDKIAAFTHEIETVLDLVRKGILSMKKLCEKHGGASRFEAVGNRFQASFILKNEVED